MLMAKKKLLYSAKVQWEDYLDGRGLDDWINLEIDYANSITLMTKVLEPFYTPLLLRTQSCTFLLLNAFLSTLLQVVPREWQSKTGKRGIDHAYSS